MFSFHVPKTENSTKSTKSESHHALVTGEGKDVVIFICVHLYTELSCSSSGWFSLLSVIALCLVLQTPADKTAHLLFVCLFVCVWTCMCVCVLTVGSSQEQCRDEDNKWCSHCVSNEGLDSYDLVLLDRWLSTYKVQANTIYYAVTVVTTAV